MAVLKYWDAATSKWVTLLGSGSGDSVPIGTVLSFAGDVAPHGYLLCNGDPIPAEYTKLIELVGANTPDLRNRFIVGVGSDYALKDVGGEKMVTLTVDQMPPHGHQTGISGTLAGQMNDGNQSAQVSHANIGQFTANTGGGQAHENRPPYYALVFIIKAATPAQETASGGGGPDEVAITPDEPGAEGLKLWVDDDEVNDILITKGEADRLGAYAGSWLVNSAPIAQNVWTIIPYTASEQDDEFFEAGTLGRMKVKQAGWYFAVLHAKTGPAVENIIRIAKYGTDGIFQFALGTNAIISPAPLAAAVGSCSGLFRMEAGESLGGNIWVYVAGQEMQDHGWEYPQVLQIWRLGAI